MKDALENVDRLSKDALSDWEVPPPSGVATKIQKRMFWFNLWRKPISKISLVALCLMLCALTGWILALDSSHEMHVAKEFDTMHQQSHYISQPVPGKVQTSGHSISAAMNAASFPEGKAPLQNNITSSEFVKPVAAKSGSSRQTQDAGKSNNSLAKVNSGFSNGKVPSNQESLMKGNKKATSEIMMVQRSKIQGINNKNSQQPEVSGEITENQYQTIPHPLLRYDGIQKMPLPFSTEIPNLIVQNSPRKSYHTRPQFDLSLTVTPSFGNLGEKKTSLLKIKTKEPSGTLALLLQYNFKCWFIETGFQYTLLQNTNHADQLLCNPQETNLHLLAGQEISYDTNSYWHYTYIQDSIIHIRDSVWATETDSTYTNIYNDSIFTSYDTLNNISWNSNFALYEIPLAVGYRFYSGPLEFNLKGGIILGIASKLTGQVRVENSSAGLVSFPEYYSSKQLQYSWFISGTAMYPFGEQWYIMLTPTWRSSINGFSGNEGVHVRKYSAWGIGLGLHYEF